MSKHDTEVSLRHLRDHIEEALELTQGKTRADLDLDRKLNLSLVRLLEIAGEAANRVPKEERTNYPAIPWSQIIGLRNRLIHAYDQVDFDVLWEIVNKDLPYVLAALKKIVPPEEDS